MFLLSCLSLNQWSWVEHSTWTSLYEHCSLPLPRLARASSQSRWTEGAPQGLRPNNESGCFSAQEGNRPGSMVSLLCSQPQTLLVQLSCSETAPYPSVTPIVRSQSCTHQPSACKACAGSSPCKISIPKLIERFYEIFANHSISFSICHNKKQLVLVVDS